MPFSSPSYFPSVRTTDRIIGLNAGSGQSGDRVFFGGQDAGRNSSIQNAIIIGSLAGDAGITDAELDGSTIIGQGAAGALTLANRAATSDRAVTVLGGGALGAAVNAGGSVVVGSLALSAYVGSSAIGGGTSAMVVIGADALRDINGVVGNELPPISSVVIGCRAALGTNGSIWNLQSSVLIGNEVALNTGAAASVGAGFSDSVIIGHRAALAAGQTGTSQLNVLIGSNVVGSLSTGSSNVVIGASAALGTTSSNNVLLGANIGGNNILTSCIGIGQAASIPNNSQRCIYLGANAGTTAPAQLTDLLLIETAVGGTKRTAVYAVMGNTGTNIILGNSTEATDRDTGGAGALNIVKLINGAVGAANPVGGGYLVAVAGALRWIGSAGTNTLLAPA